MSAVPASAGGYDLRNYVQKERGIGLVLTGVQIEQRRRAGVAATKIGGGARSESGKKLVGEPLQGVSGSAGASRRPARELQRGSGVQGDLIFTGGEKFQ